MKLYTTIEIDEIETEVVIDFEMYFGVAEISKITDVKTGNALGLEVSDWTYNELMEYAADMSADKVYSKFNYQY